MMDERDYIRMKKGSSNDTENILTYGKWVEQLHLTEPFWCFLAIISRKPSCPEFFGRLAKASIKRTNDKFACQLPDAITHLAESIRQDAREENVEVAVRAIELLQSSIWIASVNAPKAVRSAARRRIAWPVVGTLSAAESTEQLGISDLLQQLQLGGQQDIKHLRRQKGSGAQFSFRTLQNREAVCLKRYIEYIAASAPDHGAGSAEYVGEARDLVSDETMIPLRWARLAAHILLLDESDRSVDVAMEIVGRKAVKKQLEVIHTYKAWTTGRHQATPEENRNEKGEAVRTLRNRLVTKLTAAFRLITREERQTSCSVSKQDI